jgi:hypothetical protein
MPDDDDVHGGDIDGETPPVHEPGHVYNRVIYFIHKLYIEELR